MASDIIITHPKVVEFFNTHPSIDPGSMFCSIIDVFDHVLSNIKTDATEQQFTTILSDIKTTFVTHSSNQDTKLSFAISELDKIKLSVQQHGEELTKINQHMLLSLFERFSDLKKDFTTDIHNLIHKLNHDETTNASDIIEKRQTTLLSTIETTLKSYIHPDTFSAMSSNIHATLAEFQHKMTLDNQNIILQCTKQDTNAFKLEQYLVSFKQHFDTILSNINQPLTQLISDQKTIYGKQLDDINNSVSTLNKSMIDVTDRFKNSSLKGRCGENILSAILNKLYPNANILDTTTSGHAGDFIMTRERYNGKDVRTSKILFENKDFTTNVPLVDLNKFNNDVNDEQCSGILFSHSSGIAGRNNWQIDIMNLTCKVYLHNVKYDPETIRVAIELVDSIEDSLITLHKLSDKSDSFVIPIDTLREFEKEIRDFYTKKDNALKNIIESNKKIIDDVKTLDIPNIRSRIWDILSISDETNANKRHKCPHCTELFVTKQALGSHSKIHKPILPTKKSNPNPNPHPNPTPTPTPNPTPTTSPLSPLSSSSTLAMNVNKIVKSRNKYSSTNSVPLPLPPPTTTPNQLSIHPTPVSTYNSISDVESE